MVQNVAMEQQTQNQIQLLLVMPSEDESTTICAALAKYPNISMISYKASDMPDNVLAQRPVDVACLIANGCATDTEMCLAKLYVLDKQLPIIVLASPKAHENTRLMAETQITVLSAADVALPHFPALLRKLIDYEHTQRLETDFYLKDANILIQALVSANTQLAPQKVLAATCQQIRQALNVSLVIAGLIEGDQLVIVSEDRDPDYPSAIDDVVYLRQTPFLQYALTTQRTLVFSDVQTDLPRLINDLHRDKARGALITPLVAHDKVIGMVSVEHDEPRTFTRRDIELVKLIVTAAAPALDNAQLFQEAQAAQQHTEEALAYLQRLDALKTQFIQNVSHELRTPLAIVRGYIDLTLDGAFGDKMEPVLRQSFQTIQTHIHHLNTLVEAITVLEDAEMHRLAPLPQAVLPVLRIALQTIGKRVAQQQVEILADLPPTLPEIEMDTHYIVRALEQIFDNAIKFNRKPGRIWFKAWADEDDVWLQIKDEGIGIPATELPHIFTRFYQIDGTTSRKYGGMGLGLAIVKEIVAAHHGRVWAESEGAGCGTTLTITLPIYQSEVHL